MKILYWLSASVLCALIAACGGGGGEAGTPPFQSSGAGTPPFQSGGAGTSPFGGAASQPASAASS